MGFNSGFKELSGVLAETVQKVFRKCYETQHHYFTNQALSIKYSENM